MAAFTPTDEQVQAVDLAKQGRSMAIEALAGAGKTSTLRLVADALAPKRCAYLAFNRKVKIDAERSFPGNVKASTMHGIAMGQIGFPWCRERLDATSRMTNRQMADALGLDAPLVIGAGEEKTVEIVPKVAAGIAHRTIEAYCRSAEEEITVAHVPNQRGLDEPGSFARNNELAEAIVPLASRIWADLVGPGIPRFRFAHSHYLKLWQLGSPTIPADVILFDEAQDANPLMMSIVERQRHAQIVWVGDSNQAIYGWNGAVDALKRADVSARTGLTQSFRFGPEIAEAANVVLDRLDAGVKITGSGPPGLRAALESPDVFLGRTNAVTLRQGLIDLARGRRVCLMGGTWEIRAFAEAAINLQAGRPTDHPELCCFASWADVEAYANTKDGEDLRVLVSLTREDPAGLVAALGRFENDPDQADVTCSTAHKAKGAEWNRVRLLDDFPIGIEPGAEELRLLYVAVTRPREILDVEDALLYGIEDR